MDVMARYGPAGSVIPHALRYTCIICVDLNSCEEGVCMIYMRRNNIVCVHVFYVLRMPLPLRVLEDSGTGLAHLLVCD
jgi:hypothetical protein